MSDLFEFINASISLSFSKFSNRYRELIRNMKDSYDGLAFFFFFLVSILFSSFFGIILYLVEYFETIFLLRLFLPLIIISPVIFCIFALIGHFFIKLFGGDMNYSHTISTFAFIFLPYLFLISIFAYIFFLFQILVFFKYFLILLILYSFIIYVETISVTHNLSHVKSLICGIFFYANVALIILVFYFLTNTYVEDFVVEPDINRDPIFLEGVINLYKEGNISILNISVDGINRKFEFINLRMNAENENIVCDVNSILKLNQDVIINLDFNDDCVGGEIVPNLNYTLYLDGEFATVLIPDVSYRVSNRE